LSSEKGKFQIKWTKAPNFGLPQNQKKEKDTSGDIRYKSQEYNKEETDITTNKRKAGMQNLIARNQIDN
jgi:hypothetical protein